MQTDPIRDDAQARESETGRVRQTEKIRQVPTVGRRSLLKAAGLAVTGGAVLGGLRRLLPAGEDKGAAGLPAVPVSRSTHPKSGDRVSRLGFGCMRYPMRPEADSPFGPEIDEPLAFRLVDTALDHGVNYFDTAWFYHGGRSEVVTGRALKRHARGRFFLADKMPGALNPDLDRAKAIFAEQLARCQVDYFDYYLLHNLQRVAQYQAVYERGGVLDFLLEQREAGRIRHLGWSFHGDAAMLEYVLSRNVDWDFCQLQLNYHDLMHRQDMNPRRAQWMSNLAPVGRMYETVRQSGLPIVVMEPLLGGRLARLNREATAVLREARPEDSAAAWAFRHAAGLEGVLTALSGMTRQEHLEENLRTFSPLVPLDEAETATLRRALNIFLNQANIPCTGCGYCVPCPYGIDIPKIFAHYNRHVDDRLVPDRARGADYAVLRRRYLEDYDREVPELRQAARCTECGRCRPKCPQMIEIPREMARLGRFAEDLRQERI